MIINLFNSHRSRDTNIYYICPLKIMVRGKCVVHYITFAPLFSGHKMVRCYRKKQNGNPSYTTDDLTKAVEDVTSGRMTIYKASKLYHIPYPTIYTNVKGTRGAKKDFKGRLTALGREQEEELANGIATLEKWGFGLSRKEVIELVAQYVKEHQLRTPFKDGVPGIDWFIGFKKRHNLSIKKPQAVEFVRKKATDPFIIYGYFALLKKTLSELMLTDQSSQIWNLDESSFSIDPTRTKVVGKRGTPCSRVTSTPGRENTTVCLMASASGQKAPPLVIFKGLNIWDQWQAADDSFPGMCYAASKKGWMDSEIFLNYFHKTVIPALGNKRPALILYDGHSTHVNASVVELAIKENITILKLPAHTTHLLQPLDLSVFKSVKTRWDEKLVKWQRQNVGRKLPKKIFSEFIAQSWKETPTTVITNGFKKGGIIPFNSQVVPRENFDKEALKRWDQRNSETIDSGNNTNVPALPGNSVNETVTTDHSNSEENLINSISNATASTYIGHSSIVGTPSITVSGKPSFEKLLLECVRQTQSSPKIPKRKLAPGAEVITSNKAVVAPKKKRSEVIEDTSSGSELDDNEVIYNESDNEEEYLRDLNDSVESDLEHSQSIDVDKWVLVEYSMKKSTRHFVGKVLRSEGSDNWVVKFLRFKKKQFFWPAVDDEDIVDSSNILKTLPPPTADRRGSGFTFQLKFDGINLC